MNRGFREGMLTREEALEISNITDEEYESIVAAALAVDEIIERE